MSGTGRESASGAKNACARPLGNADRPDGVHPGAQLGAVLADARAARGMSMRDLAGAVGAAPSTVSRIERGLRRVSPAMLAALADALADDPAPLLATLTDAAGPLLCPDTPGGVRRRERRRRRAARTANMRARREIEGRMALLRRAGQLKAQAFRVLDDRAAIDDAAALAMVGNLLDEADRLKAQAGPGLPPVDALVVAEAMTFARTATRATGKRRRKRSGPPSTGRAPRAVVEPPRDGSATEAEVMAWAREVGRRELGVIYAD